jgi:hypothetical protein
MVLIASLANLRNQKEYAVSSRERGVSAAAAAAVLHLLSPPIWHEVTLTCS